MSIDSTESRVSQGQPHQRPTIERLEERRLLSATLAPLRAIHAVSHPAIHVTAHHAARAKITISSEILGDYSGFYTVGLSSGSVALSVTNIRGKTFTGTLSFYDNVDGQLASNTFKATMGKYGKFKLKFKSGGTSFTANGDYNPQSFSPEMTVLVSKGKFDGRKISRFIPGEFVVMQGL